MNEITYYAVISSGNDCIRNGGDVDCDEFAIMFPDLPCAYSCADSMEDALVKAANALEDALELGPLYGESINPPSPLSKIKLMIDDAEFKEFFESSLSYEIVPITVST